MARPPTALSGSAGNVPFSSHRTSPVTSYVPLPVEVPVAVELQWHGEVALKVSEVPPPVTALEVPPPPAGATKVPEPVSVIFEQSLALAEAMPGGGAPASLTMSQRTWAAWPMATELVAVIHNSVTPIPKNHRFLIFMFLLLSLCMSLEVRSLSFL